MWLARSYRQSTKDKTSRGCSNGLTHSMPSEDKCCNLYEIVAMLEKEWCYGQVLKPKLTGWVTPQTSNWYEWNNRKEWCNRKEVALLLTDCKFESWWHHGCPWPCVLRKGELACCLSPVNYSDVSQSWDTESCTSRWIAVSSECVTAHVLTLHWRCLSLII